MPAEFNWWLLVVGLVIGAGAVWLILVEQGRHEADVSESDIADESMRIADQLRSNGTSIDEATVATVLRLHHERLLLPPEYDPVAGPPEGDAVATPGGRG